MGLSHTVQCVCVWVFIASNLAPLSGHVHWFFFCWSQFISCCFHQSPSYCCQQFWFVLFFRMWTRVRTRKKENSGSEWVMKTTRLGTCPKYIVISALVTYTAKCVLCRCLIPARLFKLLITLYYFSPLILHWRLCMANGYFWMLRQKPARYFCIHFIAIFTWFLD